MRSPGQGRRHDEIGCIGDEILAHREKKIVAPKSGMIDGDLKAAERRAVRSHEAERGIFGSPGRTKCECDEFTSMTFLSKEVSSGAEPMAGVFVQ